MWEEVRISKVLLEYVRRSKNFRGFARICEKRKDLQGNIARICLKKEEFEVFAIICEHKGEFQWFCYNMWEERWISKVLLKYVRRRKNL